MEKDRRQQINNEAWHLENAAQRESAAGASVTAKYYRAEARMLREDVTHKEIQNLFANGDLQNELLDAIELIQANGHEITMFEGEEVEFPGELSGSLRGTGE